MKKEIPKIEITPESKKVEEISAKEKESIKAPWVEIERESERRVSEKYLEKTQLSKESTDFIKKMLENEIDQKKIEFAQKWFEEHMSDLQRKGFSSQVSEETKIRIAIEQGALKELKTNEKYRHDQEEIERLSILRLEVEKESLHLDTQFLLLNRLEKKSEEIKNEIKMMERKGRPAVEINLKKEELEHLFKVKKELAENFSGRNLEAEARAELKYLEDFKDKYVEKDLLSKAKEVRYKTIREFFENEWNKLPPEERGPEQQKDFFLNNFIKKRIEEMKAKTHLKEDEIVALLGTGYNPETFKVKGFGPFQRIEVREGIAIPKKKFQDFVENQKRIYNEKIKETSKQELREILDKKYQSKFKESIERKIRELATSPEGAVKITEQMYRRIKDRLIEEWSTKGLKKETKQPKEIEAIIKEFDQKGKDPFEFMKDVVEARKGLKNLKGTAEDLSIMDDFLRRDYDIPVSRELLEQLVFSKEYREKFKKRKELLELLLKLCLKLLGFPISLFEDELESQGKPSSEKE